MGYGSASKVIKEHHPNCGGYNGSNVESAGSLGAIDGGGEASAPPASTNGQYETKGAEFGGPAPRGAGDLALEGPPLAATPGDPTRAMY